MGKLTKAQALDQMVHVHTDLNIFHAVVQLMEGGLLYDTKSMEAASRIIAICQSQGARLLRAYDAGRAALTEDKAND